MIENDHPGPAALPPTVRDFLRDSARLPAWADPDQLAAGSRTFMRHGPVCLASLMLASLPECYVLGNASHVLETTQRLREHTKRRVIETAQLVVDVMEPGGLGTTGEGIRSVQRVRLMHAAIRHLILSEPTRIDAPAGLGDVLRTLEWPEERGLPICQEDMAYTILTFSWVIVRSLRILGHRVDPRDEDAYVHTWAVAGHLMGVKDDLLPRNSVDAKILFEKIKSRQAAATPRGAVLTRRVLATFHELFEERVLKLPLAHRDLPRVMLRELLSNETARMLSVEPLGLFERVLLRGFMRTVNLFVSRSGNRARTSPALQYLDGVLAWKVVDELTDLPRGAQRSLFRMPLTLLGP